jgi:hypothetical protein
MFRLLAEILEALLGDVAERALERVRHTVAWVIFLITEGGAIAGAAGLLGLGTVWRVLFGLAAVWLPLDFRALG